MLLRFFEKVQAASGVVFCHEGVYRVQGSGVPITLSISSQQPHTQFAESSHYLGKTFL